MTGYRGRARVFDTLDASLEALRSGKINPGDACVVRFLGMKARFGTTAFTFQEELKGHHELFNSCAVITDGSAAEASQVMSDQNKLTTIRVNPRALPKVGATVKIKIDPAKMHLFAPSTELRLN